MILAGHLPLSVYFCAPLLLLVRFVPFVLLVPFVAFLGLKNLPVTVVDKNALNLYYGGTLS